MAHIAIIGAGLGGVPCAYGMRKRLGRAHRVTLIGSSPYFEFTPSNPWVAVGWRDQTQTRVAMREPLAAHGIDWIEQPVRTIDAEHRVLTLNDGSTVDYDYLVITTGPKLAFEEVPGLGPEGHTESICTQAHAVHAWESYQQFLREPGPIVIGARA